MDAKLSGQEAQQVLHGLFARKRLLKVIKNEQNRHLSNTAAVGASNNSLRDIGSLCFHDRDHEQKLESIQISIDAIEDYIHRFETNTLSHWLECFEKIIESRLVSEFEQIRMENDIDSKTLELIEDKFRKFGSLNYLCTTVILPLIPNSIYNINNGIKFDAKFVLWIKIFDYFMQQDNFNLKSLKSRLKINLTNGKFDLLPIEYIIILIARVSEMIVTTNAVTTQAIMISSSDHDFFPVYQQRMRNILLQLQRDTLLIEQIRDLNGTPTINSAAIPNQTRIGNGIH